jgi:hypothetical protein
MTREHRPTTRQNKRGTKRLDARSSSKGKPDGPSSIGERLETCDFMCEMLAALALKPLATRKGGRPQQ